MAILARLHVRSLRPDHLGEFKGISGETLASRDISLRLRAIAFSAAA
jgi:hypothetical protein